MKEYIERATALDICQKEYEDRLRMADYCGDTVAWNIGGAIKSLPAADVAEVRYGRWVNTNKEVEQICKCSECGYPISYFWSRTPYCPNCGALMKEDEHEAD